MSATSKAPLPPPATPEFSLRTRAQAIRRFGEEVFDLLVVGGGITGAAVARDAATRGLKVALVERSDFASGTSSRSTKLIHGGLRYLENFEFGLVFEALSERSFLLRTAPHMVRPLPFYWPVYRKDPHGKGILSLGLWFYDLLALFRAPGFHRRLSRAAFAREIPFLKQEGLTGGFRYFDASMWDDVLVIETLRAASASGAAVANYVEAVSPIWNGDLISGFRVRDLEAKNAEIELRAKRVVVCGGPWTDELGRKLTPEWKTWIAPSKGVHLIFDLKRIPVPGAVVMNHPEDGRIAFVVPRPDFGDGVVIVGTTDGPAPADPSQVKVEAHEVRYLMSLLQRYFPELQLKDSDILSAYVGVRPLMGAASENAKGGGGSSSVLQKISREHHLDRGPGGTTIVAGGKYTTHRKMAEEIVEFTLNEWKKDSARKVGPALPEGLGAPATDRPVNPRATPESVQVAKTRAGSLTLSESLLSRYGADALEVQEEELSRPGAPSSPAGFPCLASQLRHALRHEMVVHLEDFYLRRIPLYAGRADHGLPWAEELVRVWREQSGLPESAQEAEVTRLRAELESRSAWRDTLN